MNRLNNEGSDWIRELNKEFLAQRPAGTGGAVGAMYTAVLNKTRISDSENRISADQREYIKKVHAELLNDLNRQCDVKVKVGRLPAFELTSPVYPSIERPEIIVYRPHFFTDAGVDIFIEKTQLDNAEAFKQNVAKSRGEWREFVKEKAIETACSQQSNPVRFFALVGLLGETNTVREIFREVAREIAGSDEFIIDDVNYKEADRVFAHTSPKKLEDHIARFPQVAIRFIEGQAPDFAEELKQAAEVFTAKKTNKYEASSMHEDIHSVFAFIEHALHTVKQLEFNKGDWTEWLEIDEVQEDKPTWQQAIQSGVSGKKEIVASATALYEHWPNASKVEALASQSDTVPVQDRLRMRVGRSEQKVYKNPYSNLRMPEALIQSFNNANIALDRLEKNGKLDELESTIIAQSNDIGKS